MDTTGTDGAVWGYVPFPRGNVVWSTGTSSSGLGQQVMFWETGEAGVPEEGDETNAKLRHAEGIKPPPKVGRASVVIVPRRRR